jgi:hypothetical protein
MGGSNLVSQSGTYGIQGTAASSNVPGARVSAVTWTDAAGNFWLFGGDGYDSAGSLDYLNDLWKYSAGQWTWMSGSNLAREPGTYGTQGTAAPGNVPGARFGDTGWIDSSRKFLALRWAWLRLDRGCRSRSERPVEVRTLERGAASVQ